MTERLVDKVLLVGWDGADWKVINPLLDSGKMPNLQRIVENGVMGNLATLTPELSPMLWTSIATGKRPFQHGIFGFTEPNPHGPGIRPITILSRKTKAIWNILNQNGLRPVVAGWWPSHPAEPVNGVIVSEHFQRAVAPHGKPWPVPAGTVHPPHLVRRLRPLRVHPQDLPVDLILHFLPRLAEIDQEKDRRVESLAKVIADCTTVAVTAAAILHNEPWDFAAVYFDALDHFSHGFMNYHPPRRPWVDERDFELYRQVVECGYVYHDTLLGNLLREAGEGTTVILVSDHGFHSDALRPRGVPVEPAGPAVQHRPYGILAASGPGFRHDERIYGASLLDICPTILTLYGLPVGEDMDGKPLAGLFEDLPPVATIPSWDNVPGPDGCHPPGRRMDAVEAREAIRQLVALGYIAPPKQNAEQAADESVRELRYNLARSYADANRHADAVPVLEELVERWPDEARFGMMLVSCLQTLGRMERTRPLLEALLRSVRRQAQQARRELQELFQARRDAAPETVKELTRRERMQVRRLRALARPNRGALNFLLACQLLAEGEEEKALARFRAAETADPDHVPLHLKIGEAHLRRKSWLEAEASFRRCLELDPESALASLGLSRSLLPQRRNLEAATAALDAVGLLYHNPLGHYLLGVALHRVGRIPRAVEALTVAVTQNPNFPEAHLRLAAIFEKRLRDPEQAAAHRSRAAEARRRLAGIKAGKAAAAPPETAAPETDEEIPSFQPAGGGAGPIDLSRTVVIVTGLPRSGTSMMMQMLRAGGLPPLTDGRREADEGNPRGYFEYEPATRLREDSGWLPQARGKALKVVAQLLRHLPPADGFAYRVVLMRRPLGEVLVSQSRLLARSGRSGAALPPRVLRNAFTRQLRAARQHLLRARVPVLLLDYHQALADPASAAARVNTFLGGGLDEVAMAAAVDAGLRRERGADEGAGR